MCVAVYTSPPFSTLPSLRLIMHPCIHMRTQTDENAASSGAISSLGFASKSQWCDVVVGCRVVVGCSAVVR